MVIKKQLCETDYSISPYHPCGMLDRDQRTTKHLPKFSSKHSEISVMKMTNKKCYHGGSQNKRGVTTLSDTVATTTIVPVVTAAQQNRSVLTSNCNNISNNCNNLLYYQLATQNRTVDCKSSSTSCKKQTGQNNNKSKSSSWLSSLSCCGFSKLNNLLICICFWLLILQRTRAMPITSDSCKGYKEAIKMILKQAQMSYGENLNGFNEFTNKYFREDHDKLQSVWKDTQFPSLQPKTITSRQKELQYYDRTDPEVLAHLRNEVTTKIIHDELQELYERLMILDHAFDYITDEKNAIDGFDNKFYEKHRQYLKNLKVETEEGLDKLNIEKPKYDKPDLTNNSKEVRDYIVMREHLILLRYINDAYNILLSPLDCQD